MHFLSKLLPASKGKLAVSVIGVLALLIFSIAVFYEISKTEVTIIDNGNEETVQTHVHTVEELLKELGIEVKEHDYLSHSLQEELTAGMTITYETAKKVTVAVDGKEETYYTTADTIEQFFAENDIAFSDGDDISHSLKDQIKEGLSIQIHRQFEVVIRDGNDEHKVKTTGGTVKSLLEEIDIELGEKDKITPDLNEEVEKGTAIEIIRVVVKEEVVEENIPFQAITKKDPNLEKGKEKVITEGKEGKITKTFEVTYENGEEVDRKLVSEEKEDKVDKVVAIGTKEPKQNLQTLSASGSSNKSSSPANGKTFTVTASAFTSSCSGCSGYTATGMNLKSNPNAKVIAVDPRVIPLGSRVWVEGYGEAIAGDTGGHIKGNRIDVHVPSKSAAYQWGVRKVKVKILD